MKSAVERVAGRLADVVREMNEAQRLVLVRQTALDWPLARPETTPDTYQEFLARTAGVLRHEPAARKRRQRHRG
jgi:hypothetical protein